MPDEGSRGNPVSPGIDILAESSPSCDPGLGNEQCPRGLHGRARCGQKAGFIGDTCMYTHSFKRRTLMVVLDRSSISCASATLQLNSALNFDQTSRRLGSTL